MITRNDIVEYINRPGIPMKVISAPERYGHRTVVTCKWKPSPKKRTMNITCTTLLR